MNGFDTIQHVCIRMGVRGDAIGFPDISVSCVNDFVSCFRGGRYLAEERTGNCAELGCLLIACVVINYRVCNDW